MAKPTIKVLIVDDDADMRESISLALKEQTFVDVEITESSDVISGIKQAKNLYPDVIVLDLHMRNKSGWDFMNILHKNARLANIRVVMLTAYATPENIFKAEKKGIGAYQFLGKPFNIAELQALVLNLPIN